MEKQSLSTEAIKKFKEIRRLFRDKSVVGFRISLKMYSEGSEQPKDLFLQGERQANGSWGMWAPSHRNSRSTYSPKSVRKKLALIERRVHEYITGNTLDEAWPEYQESIRNALESGMSLSHLEYGTEIPFRAIASYGYKAHFYAPVMATVYAIEGENALANDDLSYASYCVDQGCRWSNSDMFILNPTKRFADRARTGALGRLSRYEQVKEKVAELLKVLKPDGWESTKEAKKAVAEEMQDKKYLKLIENAGLVHDNIPRTVREWIKNEPERFPHSVKS